MAKYVYRNNRDKTTIETDLEEDQIIELLDDDNEFASSLKKQYKEKGFLSESQFFWAVKLVKEKPQLFPCNTTELFEVLKKGKITVKWKELNLDLRIYPNGVIYYNGTNVGKYDVGGLQVLGTLDPKIIHNFLLTFIKEGMTDCAVRIGKKSGYCCFCAKELTHEISKAAGYGPVCANKYDLPFDHEKYAKGMA